jgi:hypothetical protein
MLVRLLLVAVSMSVFCSAKTAVKVVTVDPGKYTVSGPDPICPPGSKIKPNYFGTCKIVEVILPVGAQFVSAVPEARDHVGAGDWKPCPAVPNGAVYPFMDCAANVGYLRFIKTSPAVEAKADGVHVTWQAINWASYQREVRITVQYN